MNKPRFNFGDYVYHAASRSLQESVVCPDCNGDRYVTIIYQGETYTVDCEGCKHGYLGSTGVRDTHVWKSEVHEGFVEAIEKEWNEPYGFEYRISADNGGRWVLKEEDTFATKEEAEVRAEELTKKQQANTDQQVVTKIRPDKTWAWNVTYYKRQIKDAQKTIEYATLQLNAAKKHVKEPA